MYIRDTLKKVWHISGNVEATAICGDMHIARKGLRRPKESAMADVEALQKQKLLSRITNCWYTEVLCKS